MVIFFQVFAYTHRQQIMSDDNCLDAASPDGPVKLVRCHGMGGNQAWVYDKEVSGDQEFHALASTESWKLACSYTTFRGSLFFYP